MNPRTLRLPLLATILSLLFSVVVVSTTRADDISDGPIARTTLIYSARAQVVDYSTLGAPGQIATVTVRRATFTATRSIVANTNASVGVRTNVAGRVYAFTCSYRGQRLTKYVQATRLGGYVQFSYGSDGRLR